MSPIITRSTLYIHQQPYFLIYFGNFSVKWSDLVTFGKGLFHPFKIRSVKTRSWLCTHRVWNMINEIWSIEKLRYRHYILPVTQQPMVMSHVALRVMGNDIILSHKNFHVPNIVHIIENLCIYIIYMYIILRRIINPMYIISICKLFNLS